MSEFEKEVSFDRLFPNQDYLSNQGYGNLICLPFQGKAIVVGNTVFLDPQTLEIINDQWNHIKQIRKIATAKLDVLYNILIEKKDDVTQINPAEKGKSGKVIITISSQLEIKKSNFNPSLVKFIRENLNFFNTEFIVKKNLGISTYKVERYFKLIEEGSDSVLLPRGFITSLTKFLDGEKIKFEIVDKRGLKGEIRYKAKIDLYDYQLETMNYIQDRESGVIVAPPGSGKTIVGLELINQKSQPALILVHRKQLLDQWVERIQSFLGIAKSEIGQISGRKKKIGKQITVAMMQSLARQTDLKKYSDCFGLVVVDECHHIPAKTFRELIINFNPYYLYGLTATPKRKYNDEKLIYYYIGDVIAKMDPNYKNTKQNLFNQKGQLAITVNIKETNLNAPFNFHVDEFELISKILIFDSLRNQQISTDILNEVKNGNKILVLTERKEHVEVLNLYLKSKAEIITLTGDDSASKRSLKLKQISDGHFQVLIATGQLFGEGSDFDVFNCLFLVYPFSFEGKLIQYLGRIQRTKKAQIIYDYLDKNIPYYVKLFKSRQKYYRKLTNVSSTLTL